MMFKLESKELNMILIPVAFDNMLFSLTEETHPQLRYETEKNLSSKYLESLYEEIKSTKQPVCLDMHNVSSYVSRGFKKLAQEKIPLIFWGIEEDSFSLKARIMQDFDELVTYENQNILCTKLPDVERLANKQNFSDDLKNIYNVKINDLLKSVTIKADKGGDASKLHRGFLLESSGVYVNHYVALKNLFLDNNNSLFLVYLMARKIHEKYPNKEDKALICCSKTGAVFTSILSMLLDIPAVYCVNLGPKFALTSPYLQKDIQSGQEFIFVFDFLCMGTEARILNALISCLGAKLIYGIGVSNFLDFSEPQFTDGFFSKLETLVDIRSAIPEYWTYPVVKESIE